MFSPKMEARCLQELQLTGHEKVLESGTGTGYMASLLAQQAAHVTTIEINPAIAQLARDNLKKNGVTRVKVLEGCGFALAPTLGQFDVILISGGSEVLPTNLLDALNPMGRLMVVTGKAPVMQLVLSSKSRDGQLISTPLFETMAKPLVNSPKANEFVF